MKTVTFKRTLIAAIALATAPYSPANALSQSEISSVRSVLRALNVDDSQLSNQDIETLRDSGNATRAYEKSKIDLLNKASEGEIYRTCGAGSHGGDNDPV